MMANDMLIKKKVEAEEKPNTQNADDSHLVDIITQPHTRNFTIPRTKKRHLTLTAWQMREWKRPSWKGTYSKHK